MNHPRTFWRKLKKKKKKRFLIWNIENNSICKNAINIGIFTIYCNLKFSLKNFLFHIFTICANRPGWIVPVKKKKKERKKKTKKKQTNVCANPPRRNWFLCEQSRNLSHFLIHNNTEPTKQFVFVLGVITVSAYRCNSKSRLKITVHR